MKRILSLLLALILVFGLFGCSGSAEQETAATKDVNISSDFSTVQTDSPKTPTAQIQEVVVYDDGLFKLTAKEIDYSDSREVQVKFLAENNSDKTVAFVGNDFTINGITLYCNFYIDIAAGKKANGSLDLDLEDLEYVGIEEIATITAQDVFIYDKDASETVAHLSFSLDTSIADSHIQKIDDSGDLLYEQSGIRVLYRGIETNWMGEPVLSVFVENTSDVSCSIMVEDVSVNGFMVYANMSAPAYPGTVTYSDIDFSGSDLEENEISEIEEVSFKLWAYDGDNYTTLWRSEEITVTAKAIDGSSQSDSIDSILASISSALSYENLTVDFNGTSVIVEYWVDGLSAAVSMAKSGDNSKADLWNQYIASEQAQCTTLAAVLEEAGFSFPVVWNIVDDQTPGSLLLTIADGQVTYNAAE